MIKENWIYRSIVCVLICEVTGLIGGIPTFPAITGWYANLQKPWFTPPDWVFAPAWTTLYFLMGLALAIIWGDYPIHPNSKRALITFDIQFTLNVAWSFLFFGLKSPFMGLVGIIPLWITILLSIIEFRKVDDRAALLMIPYLLWTSFALLLNYSVWIMN